jgi:PelA/Pel-15E family pectate lyase
MAHLTSRFLTFCLVSGCLWLAQGCWPERDDYARAPSGEGDDGSKWWEQDQTPEPKDSGLSDEEKSQGGADGDQSESSFDDGDQPGSAAAQDAGTDEGSDGREGSDAPLLSQTGNPIYQQLSSFGAWLSSSPSVDERLAEDVSLADNMLTWQMPHGGFFKNGLDRYGTAWDGSAPRSDWYGAGGVELGTIDNDATVNELLFLADVYRRTGEETYREGARRTLDFLLTMQLPTGGFPQTYPARTGTTYSNYVTFNDDAMVRVLVLLLQLTNGVPPLDGDVFDEAQHSAARTGIDAAVDYIVKAQIVQDGEKTVWCAQHDPGTYEPREGRTYELPSKSGKESVGVVAFLMTQPQTPRVEAAVRAALAWYERDEVQFADTKYVSRASGSSDDSYNPIQPSPGSTMWCRFYELEQDVCFFSGRLPTDKPPGVGKQYDIMDIEPERRYGYQWGGDYGTPLLEYAARVGY